MTTATFAAPAARRNQNLNRQEAVMKLGPVSARFVVIAIITLLALLYLNQVTKTSYFTYRSAELTQARNQLLSQKQDLSVEAARLQSIHTVQNSKVVAAMVPEGTPTYAK